ncbi:hypothetical protein [Vibrio aestuarianus]|uniref:hypothetical protein n=1 Tax=Vibrio aestuarianus TaxID=28171 RepID=UPI00237C8A0F|nr:hypothetical protein [Vibrio aestuarianus]MDE1334033.1 hypothetical protein [Vibrio aestuarianus]
MDISVKECTSIALKQVFHALGEARLLFMEHRVKEFLRTVDDQIEELSLDEIEKINAFLSSNQSKKLLSDYAEAITNTSSDIAIRALALLFIDDRQFNFDNHLKSRFITCINGIDDLKINLFLELSKLKESQRNTIYPVYHIDHLNFDNLDLGVDIDELFSYVEDFTRRGLLLRDPSEVSGAEMYEPNDQDWSVSFGISSTLQRFAALLRKAKYLSGQ